MAVNSAGTRAYVANRGSNFDPGNSVSVIDTATNTVVATVAVGQHPSSVTVNPTGTRLYVANQSSDSVSVIDTATNAVVTAVVVGSGPVGVAVR